MVGRRLKMGELEAKAMEILWSLDGALTPGEVHERLSAERSLAYTTVMTILTRLWKKGALERERDGRAFAYRPVETRAEAAARRMRDILDTSGNRDDALASFLGSMSRSDKAQLRRLLDRHRS